MSFESRIEEKLDTLSQVVGDLRIEVKGVSTKVNIIVGPDGTNGMIKDHADRLAAVEKRATYAAGAFGVVGIAIGGIMEWTVKKLFGLH